MLTRNLAVLALVALTLVGCTPDASVPTPSLTPAVEGLLNPELVPRPLADRGSASATVEATRLADALQALIDSDTIINVDDKSQLAPAQDDLPAYYVAFRTYTLDPSIDPLVLAETLTGVLEQSGWIKEQSTTEGGIYVAALSGGTEDSPWFMLVGGDATVDGQSVVTIQLASPDIEP